MNEPLNHRARKRFGQNFLHDQNIVRKVIAATAIRASDHVLEIGPGRGALTRHLVELTDKLDLVELDRDLAEWLRTQYRDRRGVRIHQADILRFDLATLLSGAGEGAEEMAEEMARKAGNVAEESAGTLRVIGNLPYNISTPVIFHLLRYPSLIRDMNFMLQKEVVERLAAGPGTKNYGRLGLMVQYHCKVDPLFDVPPTAFRPMPGVTSSIVRLTPWVRPPYPAKSVECLENVIRTAFAQRRKTLKNSLKHLISEDVWMRTGIDSSRRPENLELAEYVKISDAISG